MPSTTQTKKRRGQPDKDGVPSGGAAAKPPKRKRNYARWRAISLSLVYLVFAAHILHWRITGKTLAPLELNEVMYTLELGIITAGFLFMCILVLGTTIFGRFFCSWACHIMVLQDCCAWLLRKIKIKQKPLRSRLLLLVPPMTALYMFVWPQILRTIESRSFPKFHFRTDSEGWASFATTDFWRNLPNPPVIILTFLVCGFFIVYLLGSRTFCTYVCPYGAIFAFAERFSPWRIRVNDNCEQCGTCTAECTSGIRVHEEVKQHGMIVNPACMKDLDCISACPQDALSYGLAKPPLFKSLSSGRFGSLPYDFSIREEVLAGIVFLIVLLSFRGLYSRVPFLLSLALAGILCAMAVASLRLVTRPHVKFSSLRLKAAGRITTWGFGFTIVSAMLAVLVAHSGFIHYHAYAGRRLADALPLVISSPEETQQAQSAHDHLRTAETWGLMYDGKLDIAMVNVHERLKNTAQMEHYALRFLEQYPRNAEIRLKLARRLLLENRVDDAGRLYHMVVMQYGEDFKKSDEHLVAWAHGGMGEVLARKGVASAAAGDASGHRQNFTTAIMYLQTAVAVNPSFAAAHAELGSCLAQLNQLTASEASLREALKLDPSLNKARYNLGGLLAHTNRTTEAIEVFENLLKRTPEDADAHFSLSRAYEAVGNAALSNQHLNRAIQLEPRYRQMLAPTGGR